ncbi:hypothetical protein BZA70DRAFT_92306 [Myxozyma melibiosi]|uniref:Uncharacterized protein n=1 Tax=Myxozyma melibiosi TaxID=54550 RepID=A0ABR1EYS1_9ASCO
MSSALQTAIVLAAPFLIPRAIAYYQRRSGNNQQRRTRTVTALATRDAVVLALFVAAAAAHLLHAGVYLRHQHEMQNIFVRTQVDLYTPVKRLERILVAAGGMDESTRVLLEHLKPPSSRAIYATYGADALVNCDWCASGDDFAADEGLAYRIYLLPRLLWPGMAQLGVLGFATSLASAGRLTSARTPAAFAVVLVMLAVVWRLFTFSLSANNPPSPFAQHREPTYLLHDLLTQRDGALALIDLVLACLAYLACTNRLSLGTSSDLVAVSAAADSRRRELARLFGELQRQAEGTLHTCRSGNLVRAAVLGDDKLREQTAAFWDEIAAEEGELLRDEEVERAMKGAREEAVAKGMYEKIDADSAEYAEAIVRVSKTGFGRA